MLISKVIDLYPLFSVNTEHIIWNTWSYDEKIFILKNCAKISFCQ